MADKKISELVSLAGKDVAATDFFPVVDVSVAETKSLTRDELRNAVNAIHFTATKALATTAAASLPDDTIIEVAADESLAGARTRYKVAAGALVFDYGVVTKADLADASDPAKGAALVGFKQDGENSIGETLRDALLRTYWVEQWGANGNGAAVNTVAFSSVAADTPAGAKINFQPRHYVGNLLFSKSVHLAGNGCRITPSNDAASSIFVGPPSGSITAHPVTETTLAYGDKQFNVVGASALFTVGDIGVLWDSAVRASDSQPVNYEVVKIKLISADTITVEGYINSYKGVGPIKFLHTPNQFKGVTIEDFEITPPPSNVQRGVSVFFVDGVRIRRIKSSGFTGAAVYAQFCYNVQYEDIAPESPHDVSSGNGYGAQMYAITKFDIRRIVGSGCRHALDIDSCYDGEIDTVDDQDDQNVPCMIAHNGFGGSIRVKNVKTRTGQYAVYASGGGYGTTGMNPRRENHPFRNLTVDGVICTFKSTVDSNTSCVGVYFANSLAGTCAVRNVKTRFESTAALTTTNANAVRVDGLITGTLAVDNVEGDKIGRVFVTNGNYGTGTPEIGTVSVRNIKYSAVGEIARASGGHRLDIDVVRIEAPIGGSFPALVVMAATGGRVPLSLTLGKNITYGGDDLQLFSATSTPKGSVQTFSRSSSVSITVTAAQVLTQQQVQNRLQFLRLVGPSGAGAITIGEFPAPLVDGIELRICGWSSGRNDVTIPAGATFQESVTFGSTQPYASFISHSGLWVRCA